MNTDVSAARTVSGRVHAHLQTEGGGFVVQRPFPGANLDMVDPFLLLDEMGPTNYGPGEAVGAPDHPHRGFETVTYMLEGTFQHKDSVGNSGLLTSGAVQWMTAGAGVVHSEMPSDNIMEKGGKLHGFQLWVNLPAAEKMVPACYQEFPAEGLPVATSEEGVWVRVIAGEALGVGAVIETHTPIIYLHFILQPGAEVSQPVPKDFNVFAYVVDGEVRFGKDGHEAGDADLVVFAQDGESVTAINTGTEPLSFLLLGGVPLNEPVARYGPFVMNTKDEIHQAITDYYKGMLGRISV